MTGLILLRVVIVVTSASACIFTAEVVAIFIMVAIHTYSSQPKYLSGQPNKQQINLEWPN